MDAERGLYRQRYGRLCGDALLARDEADRRARSVGGRILFAAKLAACVSLAIGVFYVSLPVIIPIGLFVAWLRMFGLTPVYVVGGRKGRGRRSF